MYIGLAIFNDPTSGSSGIPYGIHVGRLSVQDSLDRAPRDAQLKKNTNLIRNDPEFDT